MLLSKKLTCLSFFLLSVSFNSMYIVAGQSPEKAKGKETAEPKYIGPTLHYFSCAEIRQNRARKSQSTDAKQQEQPQAKSATPQPQPATPLPTPADAPTNIPPAAQVELVERFIQFLHGLIDRAVASENKEAMRNLSNTLSVKNRSEQITACARAILGLGQDVDFPSHDLIDNVWHNIVGTLPRIEHNTAFLQESLHRINLQRLPLIWG